MVNFTIKIFSKLPLIVSLSFFNKCSITHWYAADLGGPLSGIGDTLSLSLLKSVKDVGEHKNGCRAG